LTKNKSKLGKIRQILDHNIGLWEKRQFFRRKLSKIAENYDHNIDPSIWYVGFSFSSHAYPWSFIPVFEILDSRLEKTAYCIPIRIFLFCFAKIWISYVNMYPCIYAYVVRKYQTHIEIHTHMIFSKTKYFDSVQFKDVYTRVPT
jgi:hypothetical protein